MENLTMENTKVGEVCHPMIMLKLGYVIIINSLPIMSINIVCHILPNPDLANLTKARSGWLYNCSQIIINKEMSGYGT